MTLPPLRLTSLALKDHISVLTSFEIKFLKKHHLLFALELGLLSFVGVLVAIITLIFTNEIFTKPKILSVYPSEIDNKATVASPVTVQFDHPVNQSEVKAEISPKVSGSWVFSPGNNLFFNKKLTFKPKVTLSTNTLYQVKIKNIRAIVGPTTSFNYEFQFRTQKLPEVSSIQNLKIGPGEPFIVNLDATNDFLAEFNFNFSPTVKFRQQLSIEKRQYILTPLETLKQGTTYQLTIAKTPIKYDLEHKKVLDREEPQPEKSLSFVTTPQPTILSVSSSGSSASTGPITVNFDKDMDKYSVANYLSLKPTTAYTLIWKDAKTLVINPKEKLPFNTSYELSFAKETKAQDGSFFETDFTSSFTTIGNVKVSQFTPSNGAKGIAIGSKIYVTFDQAVDQKSAQNHFSISPNVAGSFSWNQNMLIFTPSASLPYSSTYTVTVSSGIKSLNALDSITEFKTSFTTAALYEVVKLQVPVFKQRYSLSLVNLLT